MNSTFRRLLLLKDCFKKIVLKTSLGESGDLKDFKGWLLKLKRKAFQNVQNLLVKDKLWIAKVAP